MADNFPVRDSNGTARTMRTTEIGGVHIPQHRIADPVTVTGLAGLSAANTDLISGDVNGWYDTLDFFSASIQIIASAGITAGQVIFEQTNDPSSTTGVSLAVYEGGVTNNVIVGATSIAASTRRIFNMPLTARYLRVRISTAFAGGTVQAIAVLSQQPYAAPVMTVQQSSSGSLVAASADNIFYNDSSTAQAASATLTGSSRDVGAAASANHRYSAFNVMAFADQAGTLRIEVSNDNSTWRRATADTAVAANTPVIMSIPVMTRYHRAVYVNGATAQGAFMLNTSFTAS